MNGQNLNKSFGIKSGLNYSIFKLNSSLEKISLIESNNKIGFHFGGYLNFKILEQINVQTELLFSNLNSSALLGLSSIAFSKAIIASA